MVTKPIIINHWRGKFVISWKNVVRRFVVAGGGVCVFVVVEYCLGCVQSTSMVATTP